MARPRPVGFGPLRVAGPWAPALELGHQQRAQAEHLSRLPDRQRDRDPVAPQLAMQQLDLVGHLARVAHDLAGPGD